MTSEHKPHQRPDERMLDGYHSLTNGYRTRAQIAEARVTELEERNAELRELVEEAHRFALVLAELKVRTRPFAEAWLDKYRAQLTSNPASEPDSPQFPARQGDGIYIPNAHDRSGAIHERATLDRWSRNDSQEGV